MLKRLIITTLLTTSLLSASEGLELMEAVPPADACRGLVKVSAKEYRHYSNNLEGSYLASKDSGKTWALAQANKNYPPSFGGVSKEAPSLVQNPVTKEWIRVQAIRGPIFISKGGIDGQWFAVGKDGKLTQDWQKLSKKQWLHSLSGQSNELLVLPGLLRTPVFVNNGKRIVIPAHPGPKVHYSDDNGLTWKTSKSIKGVENHTISGVHKGIRWQNKGVGGTVTELNNGKLWMLVRTSQDQLYETFSSDYGETWDELKPSRFYGTLTLASTARLKDGRLVSVWNNYTPLPEVYRTNRQWMEEKGYKKKGGEDTFNNRDALHAAISDDDGKTWTGFREVILDEHRNNSNYAVYNGSNDRGKHQTEFFQVAKNKIFLTIGQHKEHRKFALYDLSVLYEKERKDSFKDGLKNWTHHSFIPYVKGHCAYNRKPAATLVKENGQNCLLIKRNDDSEMCNPKYEIDYQKGGAAWNFPKGDAGAFAIKFKLNKGSGGTQLSLMDRLFNAVDETAPQFAMYTLNLKPGSKLGTQTLKADVWYTLQLKWNGSTSEGKKCLILLNKKRVGYLDLKQISPNGISYLHLISTAEKPDTGILIQSVQAKVQ